MATTVRGLRFGVYSWAYVQRLTDTPKTGDGRAGGRSPHGSQIVCCQHGVYHRASQDRPRGQGRPGQGIKHAGRMTSARFAPQGPGAWVGISYYPAVPALYLLLFRSRGACEVG